MQKKQNPKKSPTKKVEQLKEGNVYDKILKENMEEIFLPFVEFYLDIKIDKFDPLQEKMQATLE